MQKFFFFLVRNSFSRYPRRFDPFTGRYFALFYSQAGTFKSPLYWLVVHQDNISLYPSEECPKKNPKQWQWITIANHAKRGKTSVIKSRLVLTFHFNPITERMLLIFNLFIFACIVEEHGVADNAWLKSGSWSLVKGPFVAYEAPVHWAQGRSATPQAPESIPLLGSKDLIWIMTHKWLQELAYFHVHRIQKSRCYGYTKNTTFPQGRLQSKWQVAA